MSSITRPDDGKLFIDGELTTNNFRVDSTAALDLANPPADYASANAAINVQGGAYIGGDAYISGTLMANGDMITLGNSDGGTLTFHGNIASNLLPDIDGGFEVGNSTKQWGGVSSKRISFTKSPEPITDTNTTNTVEYIDQASGDGNNVISLADGTDGQMKILVVTTTLTSNKHVIPDSMTGFTDIVLTEQGQSVTLLYTNNSWFIISNYRASVTV
jgi:hypothetical protein